MATGARDALARLRDRTCACWRQKLLLFAGLTVGICVPYFGVQRLVGGAPFTPGPTALDDAIAFEPAWIWAYVSLAVLVPLAPGLATRREELRGYALGLATLCLPSFVIFALFPALGPRPESVPDAGLYGFIVSVDRPLNSLPSLHAGLTAYSLSFGWRVLRDGLHGALRIGAGALALGWGAAILYATLATKQHWVADLPPGIALAAVAHWVAWRPR